MNDSDKHSPYLEHHFDTLQQQYESTQLGMWIFLATEIMLFGGLFVGYAVFRSEHPEIFRYASRFLDVNLGGLNTIVLICSSLTMAWAVRAAQLSQNKILFNTLLATFLLACAFLGIKAIEYEHKWKHGLLWGEKYQAQTHETQNESADAPEHMEVTEQEPEVETAGEPKNVHLFFGIYFSMTGLHAIHVIVGMAFLIFLMVKTRQGVYHAQNFTFVDMFGLYWHIVDIIWIFLFPLLYLI